MKTSTDPQKIEELLSRGVEEVIEKEVLRKKRVLSGGKSIIIAKVKKGRYYGDNFTVEIRRTGNDSRVLFNGKEVFKTSLRP